MTTPPENDRVPVGDEITERIAEALRDHTRLTALDKPFSCSCDPYTSDSSQSWSAHLAAALRPTVDALRYEARREVVERVEAVLRSSWADVRTHGHAASKIRAALATEERP